MSIEEKIDGLGKQISADTRAGRFQGEKGGALHYEKNRLELVERLEPPNSRKIVEAYSAASSTYYAAFGNAWAHFLATPWKGWWLIRGVWYLRAKAWRMSNKMVKLAGGIQNLKADELDVRASIARKCGRHAEAMRCVKIALDRPDLSHNTQVLLLLHLAAEFQRQKLTNEAGKVFLDIEAIINQVPIPEMTQVRVLRAWAKWMKMVGAPKMQIKTMLDGAAKLAVNAGLGDQVAKMQAGM